MTEHIQRIASTISEDPNINYLGFRKAVAIVMDDDGRFLIGKATNSDRKGQWCFPGGHLNENEDPIEAAVRECLEETGVQCEANRPIIRLAEQTDVAFVPCRKISGDIKPSSEFSDLEWMYSNQIRDLENAYLGVKRVLEDVIF